MEPETPAEPVVPAPPAAADEPTAEVARPGPGLAAARAEPVPAPVRETAHDRHTREFEQSLEVLEETVEHGLVKVLKIAVPLTVAFVLTAVGLYILGGKMRDRSEARRVARAMRRASRGQASS
jgi:hypothetical protein